MSTTIFTVEAVHPKRDTDPFPETHKVRFKMSEAIGYRTGLVMKTSSPEDYPVGSEWILKKTTPA